MDLSGIIPIFTERRDEGDKANLAGHRKQFGDFRDTSDVLSSVFRCKAEIFVEAASNHVTVQDENLLIVIQHAVESILDCLAEGGLASAGQSCEPEGGTLV